MKITETDKYIVNKGDKFIFDSNIWIELMPLYQNTNNPKIATEYAELLNKIMDEECEIGILAMELSEIYNVCLKKHSRIFFKENSLSAKKENFKRWYRPSPQFEIDKNTIINEIENIITHLTKKVCDRFCMFDDSEILNKIRSDYDFNDNFIYKFCEKNNYKLVTHDSDYKNYSDLNFEVISSII